MTNFVKVIVFSAVITAVVMFRKKLRESFCILCNAGHDTYVVFAGDEIYQECINCGYKTDGWDVTANPNLFPCKGDCKVLKPSCKVNCKGVASVKA